MAVTAAKLGSAPLTLDWTHLQGGEPDLPRMEDAWQKLKGRFASGEIGFYDAPTSDELSQAEASGKLAEKILQSRQFESCLFLGIGGSALGPVSLLGALQEKCGSGIRFFFAENPDPTEWKSTLACLKPETTLVCIVTKSGTTFETLAQALIALDWLGKERWKSHVVAITDPIKGDLKAFATQEGIPTLHIAPSIGGRFSVFSPVGLFPAALAGLSVQDFLLGAKQARDQAEKAAVGKNPLFILGHELVRQAQRRKIHVCMPYSSRLRSMGGWFVQLWGESLGKDGKGFTPLGAVGATDQHSILQLLRDGPDDKITLFITLDHVADEVKIPKAPTQVNRQPFAAFKILEGHSLHELLTYEYRATSLVLTKQGRPNLTFQVERLDERSLGALYFAFSLLTAFTGTLWEINPFDQPGVEEGKVYIRQALSAEKPDEEEDENSPVARLRRGRS
jgi:glucose-6-phosphate isomerase